MTQEVLHNPEQLKINTPEKLEMNLDLIYKVSEQDMLIKTNDHVYKNEVIKIIKNKCAKEDFEFYRKNHFEGKTPEQIDAILTYVKDQQVYCVKNIDKIKKTWLNNSDDAALADKTLSKALMKTREKTLVDRKIIDEFSIVQDAKGKTLNSKELSLYVYGSKALKADENQAWMVYEVNKSKVKVESTTNVGQYFLGALILMTIYVVFLRKNEQKVIYPESNVSENDNNEYIPDDFDQKDDESSEKKQP